MRALILLECAAILALAALILFRSPPGREAAEPEIFPAGRFIADANAGEGITYRIDQGQGTLEFHVVASDRGTPMGPPKLSITRTFRDAAGTPVPDVEPTYVHHVIEHFLFPFLTPAEPKAWDRTWVLRRIRRDEIRFLGRPLRCWKVEAIDPALEPDQDAVVMWMHEDVDVYGIVRWERAGHVYECTSWRPKS
jgi:hypothetical protein